ncbi:Glycosyl hydrolase family protein [Hibiscus syriacus]|uniref:Glycosyl hydrolase family protein n=1 Tax=Hibiscus syriacus TaxID=106335 RepID=A0A6A2ZNI8_HIBSY|nr:Glycosyl hydrolase family protein [Hibiscus syriacus]
MILNNKLHIGQFIYVKELESAYPVPLLKGLRPIPGKKPFDKYPKDLIGMDIMETPLLVQQRSERARSISPYKAPLRNRRASIGGLNCRTRTHGLNNSRKKQGLHSSNSHEDGWHEGFGFRRVLKKSLRERKWGNDRVGLRLKKIMNEAKLTLAWRLSMIEEEDRRVGYHDDNSNTKVGIKDVSQSSKPIKSTSKSWNSSTPRRTITEPWTEARKRDSSNSKIWEETEMLWDTLPSSLVKLGKVFPFYSRSTRHRDATLLAAVEALQEAAATEKLLKCLNKFSELRLAKEDQHPSINKFFKLQDSMTQCRTIVQSLTNISPQRMADCDLISPGSSREALKLAVDRSRNAITWVKAAVASDLVPLSTSGTKEGKNEAKNTKQPCQITMPKGGYTITKQRSNGEFHSALAAEKENLPNWANESTLNIARNLADTLQDECETWFLAYIENYLGCFYNECLSNVPHSQVAESMCQIKRLNDWLDTMGSDGKSTSRGPKFEAYGRVRNKIYEVLFEAC